VVEAIVAGDGAAAGQAMHDDLAIRLKVLQDFYARHQSSEPDESSVAKAIGVELKLGQRVANRIAHEIVRDHLHEGDRMGSEPELLQKYGVSRAVFRESSRILESHGLVRTRRGSGGGLIVGRPDPTYTVQTAAGFLTHLRLAPRHLEEVRAAAAMTAARLAARRGTEESRQRLRDLLADQLAATGAANTLASTKVQFQIGDMSGNRALALFMRVITATNFGRDQRGLPEPAHQQLQESHTALVEAVVSGDEAVARRRMATHIQFVRQWLEDAARRHAS
jgi:DNA-binding FadR family transcriptional regulator